jgi:hypothetical protein
MDDKGYIPEYVLISIIQENSRRKLAIQGTRKSCTERDEKARAREGGGRERGREGRCNLALESPAPFRAVDPIAAVWTQPRKLLGTRIVGHESDLTLRFTEPYSPVCLHSLHRSWPLLAVGTYRLRHSFLPVQRLLLHDWHIERNTCQDRTWGWCC